MHELIAAIIIPKTIHQFFFFFFSKNKKAIEKAKSQWSPFRQNENLPYLFLSSECSKLKSATIAMQIFVTVTEADNNERHYQPHSTNIPNNRECGWFFFVQFSPSHLVLKSLCNSDRFARNLFVVSVHSLLWS